MTINIDTQDDKTNRPTILVVDDIPENLAVLAAVLRTDYRVRVATDGAKALSIVESDDPPDLILLDVMMPGMNGFDVCAQVKSNPLRRDIPIIFVTALGEVEDERRGLDLGATDYITKPISPSVVSARVRNHLELKNAREALARQNAILEVKVAERTADLLLANREIKESYLETIDLAYGVMHEADDYLGNHCKRVATYSRAIAEQMGFHEEAAFDVNVAALLHDLGLVGLRAAEIERLSQVNSPSPTRDATYWEHPVAQTRGLLKSERFARTAMLIAGHHENMDGTGFPAGTKGDAIPLGSRILAVADRWDIFAQTEAPAHGVEINFDTFAERNQGKLDPGVMAAFGEVLSHGDPFSNIVEQTPSELAAGMVVARTIRTASGAILLSAGTALRLDHIRDLARYASLSDIQLPVQVYRRSA